MPTVTDVSTRDRGERRKPGGGIAWETVSESEAERLVTEAAETILAEGGAPSIVRIVESVPISPHAANRAVARLKKNCRWPYGESCRQIRAEHQRKARDERVEKIIKAAREIEAEGGSVTKTAIRARAGIPFEQVKWLISVLEKEGRWNFRRHPRPRTIPARPVYISNAEIARNIAQALPDSVIEAQRLRAERLAREKAKRLAAGTIKGRCDEAVSEYRKARRGCRKLTKMVRGMMEAKDATL